MFDGQLGRTLTAYHSWIGRISEVFARTRSFAQVHNRAYPGLLIRQTRLQSVQPAPGLK